MLRDRHPRAPRRPSTARLWMWRLRLPGVAGLLAAVLLVVPRLLGPEGEVGTGVVVAARDLPAGTELTAADLREVEYPARLALPEVAMDLLTGRSLAVTVPAGLPVVPDLLAGALLVEIGEAGLVAAAVRLSDPELARLLRPGDRIDVLAVPLEPGASAAVVARGVRVLPVPEPVERAGGLLGVGLAEPSAVTLVAATPAEAAALATAAATGAVTAVVVG